MLHRGLSDKWFCRGIKRKIPTLITLIFIFVSMFFTLFVLSMELRSTEIISIQKEVMNKQINDLSFIIATRNDNYGGNPIFRLKCTLQQLLLYEWYKIHQINIQIVIIEWNFIDENPHIYEYDEIKDLLTYFNNINISKIIKKPEIIFYTVPSYYNDIINCNDDAYCPFFEYHAKNVGIRRSNGIWKIMMNIDDLYSIKLMSFLGHSISNKLLDENGIYQACYNEIKLNENETEQLYHNKLIHTKYDIYNEWNYNKCISPWRGSINRVLQRGGGDFTMVHASIFYKFYGGGYIEMCNNHHLDGRFIQRQVFINKLNPYIISCECSYFHIYHFMQRNKRNNYKNSIHQTQKTKKILCNQRDDKYPNYWKQNMPYNDLLEYAKNDPFWIPIFEKQHKNWGLKGIRFNYTVFPKSLEFIK